MAKDPAFLFYYDRFQSGTFSMSNTEVGMYVRLMCIQANKGHVTEKDVLHICGTLVNDVILKFRRAPDGTYVNAVLAEIVEERKAFTESRRNNRKGAKQVTSDKDKKHTSDTSVPLVVSVDKDVDVEKKLNRAFDEIFIEQLKPKWKQVDFKFELETFKDKVRGSPDHYAEHDTGGLRLALQSQLRNAKTNDRRTDKGKVNGTPGAKFSGDYSEPL